MKPYSIVSDSMFWRPDPEVEILRKHPYWVPFHREAGKRALYFDNMKQGTATAFTVSKTLQGGWQSWHLADGRGKTSLAAMEDAYRKSGRGDAELDALLDLLCDRVTPVEVAADQVIDDFESLFD